MEIANPHSNAGFKSVNSVPPPTQHLLNHPLLDRLQEKILNPARTDAAERRPKECHRVQKGSVLWAGHGVGGHFPQDFVQKSVTPPTRVDCEEAEIVVVVGGWLSFNSSFNFSFVENSKELGGNFENSTSKRFYACQEIVKS